MRRILLAALAGMATAAAPGRPAREAPLTWQVEEGRNLNAFYRQGPVAAHLLLRSGQDPRIIVAFPAGNSGVGLWFTRLPAAARWRIDRAPSPLGWRDARGRPLHGIAVTVSLDAPALALRGAVLSSTRVLRDFELTGKQPAEVTAAVRPGPDGMDWQRDRRDGQAGYRLALEVTNGRIEGSRLLAGPDGRIGFRLSALTGETPLTGLGTAALLKSPRLADASLSRTLAFLSYREKFLAGSWRFNTYFGRDTLLSLRLLMPALRGEAIEAGFASVLERLSPRGDVAHEEDIGEFAVLDHLRSDGSRSAAPVYDYRMVDESLLLAPVMADWALAPGSRRTTIERFLQQQSGGQARGALLVRNLRRVIEIGTPFATGQRIDRLIGLKPGMKAGNWRDSDDGLGGGTYAYDVNAVLMPAALDAAARLEAAGLLDRWLEPAERDSLRGAAAMARVWRSKAPPLFEVTIPAPQASVAIRQSAAQAGIDPGPALATLPKKGLRFHAIALDGDGTPILVLNSDEAFALLFASPAEPELKTILNAMMRPFPAGLASDAGLLVANPAFAPPGLQARFSRNAYHGMVIWSWQEALLVAGIDRQLARRDLSSAIRRQLTAARREAVSMIKRTGAWTSSELWSWAVTDGKLTPAAFGAASADADESNAAQLWSSVFLALRL